MVGITLAHVVGPQGAYEISPPSGAATTALYEVLNDGSANYIYGLDRLASSAGTWYLGDALGSVRQTLAASGAVLTTASYDPWGTPQGSTIAPFGFTGELQDGAGQVYLRARWYTPGAGAFNSRDPFAGWPERPYSSHPYAYALGNPVLYTDPSGQCVPWVFKYAQYDPIGFGRVVAQFAQEDCEFVFLQGQGLNVADGQAYAQAISEPVVEATQGFVALMTDQEVQRAFIERYNGPLGAIRFGGDMAVGMARQLYATGVDLANGTNCHDPNQFGRGLSRIALALGSVVTTKVAFKAVTGLKTSGLEGSEVRYSNRLPPIEVTYEMRLNPDLFIKAVVEKYGINLRGSGRTITVKFNPDLVAEGMSRKATPDVIEIGPRALVDEATLANTIAHELNHARSWLAGGNAAEDPAYNAGDALEDYIRGDR